MIYEDQLVLTGQRDINGYEIRRNIGESYRVGIEFDSSIKLNNKLILKQISLLVKIRIRIFIQHLMEI